MLTLLIVPYGIETQLLRSNHWVMKKLLIVPYGIETWKSGITLLFAALLIVPYGIETLIL